MFQSCYFKKTNKISYLNKKLFENTYIYLRHLRRAIKKQPKRFLFLFKLISLNIKTLSSNLDFNLFIYVRLRFILVYKPMSIKQFDYKKAFVSIVICFLIGLFCASAPLFGWSYYSLEGSLTSCSIEWKSRSFNVISYNMFVMVTVFIFPVTIITYTNIKLLLIVRIIN